MATKVSVLDTTHIPMYIRDQIPGALRRDAMEPTLVIQGISVVIRGDLNPAIFHPSWLARNDLVKAQEAESAAVQIVCSDVAVFSMEPLQFQVTRDRFMMSTTNEAYFEELRDLVVAIFTLLYHTPVRQIGINRDFHYRMPSEEAWHLVGHTLAPKEPWAAILDSPGMQSLTMESPRQARRPGYAQVRVEPSQRVKPYGIYVHVNNHFELKTQNSDVTGAGEAIQIAQDCWLESMDKSISIAKQVVALGGLDGSE